MPLLLLVITMLSGLFPQVSDPFPAPSPVLPSPVLPSPLPPAVERWRPLVAYFFPPSHVPTAMCVLSHESSGDPLALNLSPSEAHGGSVGLFQIAADNLAGRYRIDGLKDWPHTTMSEARSLLTDPFINVAAAHAMWSASSWLPAWAAQKKRCNL